MATVKAVKHQLKLAAVFHHRHLVRKASKLHSIHLLMCPTFLSATLSSKGMLSMVRLPLASNRHVQALSVTDEEEFWWVKADCRPEMKKDKMYRMVMSLCRGLGRLILLCVAAQLEGDYVHHVNM